ncbi:hypothetical protein B0T21DRAFT_414059 [Apiosordaria backusii]|uniref:Uncharacterized protein n=1 Tax=Apiosordaria backusii TaxID=314023 RepID=A0AA40E0R7_9PEZI|nr:hypothetical protein B0T21DRAFT_414059 [Apiosordaria backusii]
MDGSYGNVFPTNRSLSPAVGSAQANDMYKVNVSRQKTRKWANFKPQNYDGDDWGDDYDDDDEPESQPPPLSKPLGPRSPTEAQQFQRSVTMPESTGSLATLPSQSQPRKSSLDATASPTSPSSLASPSRSPFVRPADIYRKMEEERKRSLESPRPTLSSVTGPPAVERPQFSAGTETTRGNDRESAENQDMRSGLATVPERKSEYGLEGLLDSYGSEEPSSEPANHTPHYTTSEARRPAPVQESKADIGKQLRRFSTSPQLPLVTRMSGFGEDLFSPSSFLEGSQKEPPVLTNTTPAITAMPSAAQASNNQIPRTQSPALSIRQHQPEQPPSLPNTNLAPMLAAGSTSDEKPAHQVSSNSVAPAAITFGAEALGSAIGLQQDHVAAALPSSNTPTQQQPAADLPREPAASKQFREKGIVRPTLPGSWVSETPATPGEVLLPSQIEQIPAAVDRAGQNARSSAPAEHVPLKADSSHAPNDSGASPVKESGLLDTQKAPLPRPASPTVLLPLRTASPALGTTSEMPSGPESKNSDETTEKVASADLATPEPTTTTTETSEITPTAPLNPRRDPPEITTDVHPVLSPPSYGTGSTLEADTSSPLKENDVLSEEIIKSLSPVQSTEGFGNIQGETAAAYQAAAQAPVRESSYLADVYDDYWTASEEKVEAGLLAAAATGQQPEAEKFSEVPAAPVTEPPRQATVPSLNVGPVTLSANSPSSPAKPAASEVGADGTPVTGDTRRRFSWEAGFSDPAPLSIQPTVAEPVPEPKSLASPAITTLPVELDAARSSPAPGLKADAVPSTLPLADTVSQASSTLAPRSANATPIEPPSPISVLSDKSNDRNPTCTDEKIAVEPPKREERSSPAPVQSLAPQQQAAPRAPSPRKGSINILPFRQVLEMATPADRIRNFNDSRAQFAAIDTGLDEWLAMMTSRHPEHTNAFVAGFGSQQRLHSPTGAPSQQFGGNGPHGLPANIPMPPPQQHGTSGFSHLHQSAQVQKSKELLMAAGKAGKGLFSKGRNKLRGTGDKVFSSS